MNKIYYRALPPRHARKHTAPPPRATLYPHDALPISSLKTSNISKKDMCSEIPEIGYLNDCSTFDDFVGIDENNQAAPLTKAMADDGWAIGVAQVAFADNDGGWVASRGRNLNGAVLGSVAADVPLYTSATAGSLDDTSASQTKIDGVVAVAANGTTAAGNVEVLLTFPKSTTF